MGILEITFWGLSALALFGAIKVVTSKSPVFSILYLIVVFFAISGHYILMNAQFLAIVNLIVYAGAIMVLFLFVVMMMNLNTDTEPKKNKILPFAGLISGGCLFLVIIAAITKTADTTNLMQMATGEHGLIKKLGMVLFKDYVVPFEISSVLFLSAMIGAVILGTREKQIK